MLRFAIDTFGGLWQLLRLAAITRARFRGDYWTWRVQTAFGRGAPTSRLELLRAIVEYGRWVHRARRAR